ncbi:hypothetical protein DL96DRAFT_597608 [Flagelloscypha sp. PMI_526]|nr:hypothetical protein DL96DRAFT_597608 [Flagelloscypha sp. PMI_526]
MTTYGQRRDSSRSRSHSRPKFEQVSPARELTSSALSADPQRLGSEGQLLPMPSVIPPGYMQGTRWIRDGSGRPRLELLQTPEQYQVRYGSQSPSILDPPQPQCRPVANDLNNPNLSIQSESPRFSRSRSIRAHGSLSRSRSHSRSQSEQVPFPLDPTPPPVPAIPQPSRPQQRPFPVPSVIPPDFPEGTRWVVDFPGGRPYLETPDRFRVRYGVKSPAVAPIREDHQRRDSFQPQPVAQHQSSFVQYPHFDHAQSPVMASPSPQKPFLKRIFGGIVGNRGTRTPAPTPPTPISSLQTPSRPPYRVKQRSRTKSM